MGEGATLGEGARPRVSAIVCTYNRAERLERCLRALACRCRRRAAPRDRGRGRRLDGRHAAALRAAGRRVAATCATSPAAPTAALPRPATVGVKAARGELLLFTDDDCIPQEDWALRMAEALERQPLVAGAVAAAPGGFVQLCHNVAQFYGNMPCRPAGPAASIAGANMGFRRDALAELGGFAERIRCAEDMEIALRARARGCPPHFCPEAVVLHDPGRHSVRAMFRHATEHAAATVHLRNRDRQLLRTPWLLRSPVLLLAGLAAHCAGGDGAHVPELRGAGEAVLHGPSRIRAEGGVVRRGGARAARWGGGISRSVNATADFSVSCRSATAAGC